MTWGVNDSGFLAGYLAVAGLSVLAAAVWRWRVTSGGDRDHEPTAIELAYLVDGPLGACYASIAGLWRRRAVTLAAFSTIQSRGESPAGASRLTRALHQVLRTPHTWTAAVADSSVGHALAQLRRRLIRRGWLVDQRRARRARLAAVPSFALAAVGMARLAAVLGESGGHVRPGAQVGLVVSVAVTLIAAGRLVGQPRLTTVARREVRWARRRRRYLSPRGDHSWSTGSGRDLMFAVALYGSPVLRACDPRFARAIGADPYDRARERVDVELVIAEEVARLRRRRRRIRLWGTVPDAGNLGWLSAGRRPSRFWRLLWRLHGAWRAW